MVSTQLKNISQNGNLPQVGVKIKNVWNHHLVIVIPVYSQNQITNDFPFGSDPSNFQPLVLGPCFGSVGPFHGTLMKEKKGINQPRMHKSWFFESWKSKGFAFSSFFGGRVWGLGLVSEAPCFTLRAYHHPTRNHHFQEWWLTSVLISTEVLQVPNSERRLYKWVKWLDCFQWWMEWLSETANTLLGTITYPPKKALLSRWFSQLPQVGY